MSDDDLFDGAGDEETELPKDQWGRYKLPHPVTGKVAGRTRATTFAKSVADTYVLSQWSQRMAMRGLTLRPDLFALVAATPDSDRDKLNELAESAKEAASARAAANLGAAMHAFAEQADKTGKMPVGMPPHLAGILAARQRALADHRITLTPSMIERTVYVPDFDICGTFDRWGYVGVAPGELSQVTNTAGEILDDKTGRDLTYGWNEIVIQLALYANATHVLNREIFWEDWRKAVNGMRRGTTPGTMPTRCWEPMPATRRDRAVVIHMPVAQAVDNPTAPPVVTIYEVDIEAGWEAAKLCHQVREWRKRRSLAKPLSVTVPGPGAASDTPGGLQSYGALAAAVEAELGVPLDSDLGGVAALATNAPAIGGADAELQTRPPTWEERIRAASSRADLSKIWREATAKGQWSKTLEELGKEQMTKWSSPNEPVSS